MVSPLPTPETIQPAQSVEDSFGEQFYPRQLSWYAPETPHSPLESAARKIRENPWPTIGIALAAGFTLALLAPALVRATASALNLAANLAPRNQNRPHPLEKNA